MLNETHSLTKTEKEYLCTSGSIYFSIKLIFVENIPTYKEKYLLNKYKTGKMITWQIK